MLYTEFKAFFERGGELQLLIGKEPQLRSYQLRSLEEHEEKFPDFYIKRDIDRLTEDYKPSVQMLLDYTDTENEENSQIRIHIYGQDGSKEQFLHAKCYIAYYKDNEGNPTEAFGIIGSSNFTEKGLQDNAELNYLETQPLIVALPISVGNSKSHLVWFKEMWEKSVPWTGRFIQDILKPSTIGSRIRARAIKNNAVMIYFIFRIRLQK